LTTTYFRDGDSRVEEDQSADQLVKSTLPAKNLQQLEKEKKEEKDTNIVAASWIDDMGNT